MPDKNIDNIDENRDRGIEDILNEGRQKKESIDSGIDKIPYLARGKDNDINLKGVEGLANSESDDGEIEKKQEQITTLKKIEGILQDGCEELYLKMSPTRKAKFKEIGESISKKIDLLLFKNKK